MGMRLIAVGVASWGLVAGCAWDHEPSRSPSPAPSELSCAPEDLEPGWWTEYAGGIYDGEVPVTLNASGTHALVEGAYGAFSVRLADGRTVGGAATAATLDDLAGVRFVEQRRAMDALGRWDFAGATDVLAVGDSAPLAQIPWIVPRDDSGYTQVVGRVGQSMDRALLVERAVLFGGGTRGTWLRSVALGSSHDEWRVDLGRELEPAEGLDPVFGLLLDEATGVAFVTTGPQSVEPRVTRVDAAAGSVVSRRLVLGSPAPVVGRAVVGEPDTQLLHAALSGDGALLFVTTRDGVLQTLDAGTLEPVEAPRAVGIVVANEDTYIPSLRSPVASTEHGTFVAALASDGHVRIIEASTGATRATLTSVARPVDVEGNPTFPRPMQMRFLLDGLLVVTDAGVERFRCGR